MANDRAEDRAKAAALPERISYRYLVHELLGRGGMASVYRVTDLVSGAPKALKQLTLPESSEQRGTVVELFEREFHALMQLSHPRMIAVYDYGVEPSGPYYTMELLDGGDLRERTPLDWREVCTLMFDICSSLALLHSRRLLHRDVSPRNVRCTRDGRAKLIDFGALMPMGVCTGPIVGTPSFTAPEILQRSALDGRSDLYSVGATLYYALTGHVAYAARSFADLLTAWNTKPIAPSLRVAGIPPALDDLVLSLLSLEPQLRPHTAFEVMERLAAIAGRQSRESDDVSQAYLATPLLVGREATLEALRAALPSAASPAPGVRGVMIKGAAGLGRSRVLDACGLDAKTHGALVVRANVGAKPDNFSVALALTQHLAEALPSGGVQTQFPELFDARLERAGSSLRPVQELIEDAQQLRRTIRHFIEKASRQKPLVLLIDDVHRIDAPSAGVLAQLADRSQRGRLLIVMAAESELAESTQALEILASRCETLTLTPLTIEQTRELLLSMFGDVPNLDLLAGEVFRIARGSPQKSVDVAQYLLDNRLIVYTAGAWTLPSRLRGGDLPNSAGAAIAARIAGLGKLARLFGETQALALHEEMWSYADYAALAQGHEAFAIDAALSELVSAHALIGDGRNYALANRAWVAAFSESLDPQTRAERHAALATLLEPKSKIAHIRHLFAAGLDERGLDALLARHAGFAEHFDAQTVLRGNASELGPSYERALAVAERLGRAPRQVHELRRWLVSLSITLDARYYWHSAPTWLEQLKRDSGLYYWQGDPQNSNPGERIMRALQRAQQQYVDTPEAERVYRVDEAIRYLAHFVACSLAVGSRAMDVALLAELPDLLEPFAPFSPMLEAIWQNALGTREASGEGRWESARTRWIAVWEKLGNVTGGELQHVELIRNAVAYAVAMSDVMLSLPSASEWSAKLEDDALQRVSALHMRKIVRLEHGDWDGADRLRRKAEVLALQAGAPQMFTALLPVELSAYFYAGDLVGVKRVLERIEPLAARYAGWMGFALCGRGRFEQLRGDLPAAKAAFERCIEEALPKADRGRFMPQWLVGHSGLTETLLAMDRPEDARDCARAALEASGAEESGAQGHELIRSLALAEAMLGEFDPALARLEPLIASQIALGVNGLKLGLFYETRARIALLARDQNAFAHFAGLCAREYRHGARSPLGARYERLVNEAERQGLVAHPQPDDYVVSTLFTIDRTTQSTERGSRLRSSETPVESVRAAFLSLCELRAASGGHLYRASQDGPVLLVSHVLPTPNDELAQRVRERLVSLADTSDQVTVRDQATVRGVGANSDPGMSSTASVDGTTYELLLLTCRIDGAERVAGVVALAPSDVNKPVSASKQARLLRNLAQKLAANDTQRGAPRAAG